MELFLQVKGILENNTPFAFSAGANKKFTEDYPLGRNLRGAFGYIAKDAGLSIKEIFPNLDDSRIIFRDALPICGRCLQFFSPELKDSSLHYTCTKCGQEYSPARSRTDNYGTRLDRIKNSVNNFFQYRVVHRSTKFRFEVLLNIKRAERYIEELLALITIAEEQSLYLGKRHLKGLGKFSLKELNQRIIEAGEIKKIELKGKTIKIKLISDTIFKGDDFNNFFLKPEILKSSIKECLDFYGLDNSFDLELIPQNITVQPPIDLSILNYIEDTNHFRTVVTKAARRGITFTFNMQRHDENVLKGLYLLSLGYGVGRFIGLGQGEVQIEA